MTELVNIYITYIEQRRRPEVLTCPHDLAHAGVQLAEGLPPVCVRGGEGRGGGVGVATAQHGTVVGHNAAVHSAGGGWQQHIWLIKCWWRWKK